MSPAVRHVFFDFDGVLCDSLAACREEYIRLREVRFQALPPIGPLERMDVPFSGPLRTSLHRWLGEAEGKAFFDEHSQAMERRASDLRSFPGVDAMLASLPDSSVSVISSAYNKAIAEVLSHPSGVLPPSIKYLRGRDSGEPKDRKMSAILASEGLTPDEAIYVGDLESDYHYCSSIPIRCILVTYGYHSEAHLTRSASGAYALVDSVDELAQMLIALVRLPVAFQA